MISDVGPFVTCDNDKILANLSRYYTWEQSIKMKELMIELPKWWCTTEDQICEAIHHGAWKWIGPDAIKEFCRIRNIPYSMRIQCTAHSHTFLGGSITRDVVRRVNKMFHAHRRVNLYLYHLARIIRCKDWHTGTVDADVDKVLSMSAFHKPGKMHSHLKAIVTAIYDEETLTPEGLPKHGCKHFRLELYDYYL